MRKDFSVPSSAPPDQRERDRERRTRQDVELTAQMAEEIGRLFPGCPRTRAGAIAGHTALRGSGQVGRAARRVERWRREPS